jgi:uncharacterized coiled-coil protein SlyX
MSATGTTRNGSATDARIAALEQKVELLDWWRAEQAQTITRLASALAAMLTQQMQPQVQQAILAQLTGQPDG